MSLSSQVFGQLWLAMCITAAVTLTSCLIPGTLSLLYSQSKHCGLELLALCEHMPVCLAVNKKLGSYYCKAILKTVSSYIVYDVYLIHMSPR